jgi:hypothetical protein
MRVLAVFRATPWRQQKTFPHCRSERALVSDSPSLHQGGVRFIAGEGSRQKEHELRHVAGGIRRRSTRAASASSPGSVVVKSSRRDSPSEVSRASGAVVDGFQV